ncbi:hypothetical protein HMPREF9946_03137 [Acetobacteraceae bacterium AT-5844]|nr:hypothetical protein HMPREF9946_03137 [Acetobacteraceae bacterium AT-5844]
MSTANQVPQMDLPARFDAKEWTSYDEADRIAIELAVPELRNDEASIIAARQLDYVKARVYTRKLPEMTGDLLIPTETDVPEGANSVIYRLYDVVGVAKIIGNYADDLPRVDVRGREMSARVRSIGDSYGYSQQDLRASALSGTNLPARKGDMARLAVARKENAIKFVGDTAYGMYGLLNHPNVPTVTVLNGDWENPATTGQEIVDDVIALLNGIVTQSSGTHRATVIGMDNLRLSYLNTRRMGTTTEQTAGQFLRSIYPNLTWAEVPEFQGAGAGGTNVMWAAERDPANYHYEAVMPFRQYAPQARNLELVIPCEARSGGVIIEQSLSMAKMEGI